MDEYLLRAVAGIGALLLAAAIPLQVLRNQTLSLYSIGIAVAAVFLGAAAAGSKVDFSYADGTVTAKLDQLEQKVAEQDAVVTQVQQQGTEQTNRIQGLQQNVASVQADIAPLKNEITNSQIKVTALEGKLNPLIAQQAISEQKLSEVSSALNIWADAVKIGPDKKLQVIDPNAANRSLQQFDKLQVQKPAPQ